MVCSLQDMHMTIAESTACHWLHWLHLCLLSCCQIQGWVEVGGCQQRYLLKNLLVARCWTLVEAYIPLQLSMHSSTSTLDLVLQSVTLAVSAYYCVLGLQKFACGVVTWDGRHVLVDTGCLPEAVAASAAVPFLFANVDIPGEQPACEQLNMVAANCTCCMSCCIARPLCHPPHRSDS